VLQDIYDVELPGALVIVPPGGAVVVPSPGLSPGSSSDSPGNSTMLPLSSTIGPKSSMLDINGQDSAEVEVLVDDCVLEGCVSVGFPPRGGVGGGPGGGGKPFTRYQLKARFVLSGCILALTARRWRSFRKVNTS